MFDFPSFEAFHSHAMSVRRSLEARRRKYLNRFWLHVIVVLAIVLPMPWYLRDVMEAISALLQAVTNLTHAGEATPEVHYGTLEVVIVGVIIGLMGIWAVLLPVYQYRGKNRGAGLIARRYSLKDDAYSALLTFFGPFEFSPEGGVSRKQLEPFTILPRESAFKTEDYIKGVINTTTVQIMETRLSRVKEGENRSLFQGLMLLVDMSDARVKLRTPFSGRTVVIADSRKLSQTGARYHHMTRIPLHAPVLEEALEAYADHPEEAADQLTEPFLMALMAFGARLQSLHRQTEHWDSKLAHAAAEAHDKLARRATEDMDARGVLGKENHQNADQPLDVTKADTAVFTADSINEQVQAEFFEDKLLITLPCPYDLFETDSLFSPALNEEDIRLLYDVMELANLASSLIVRATTSA